MCVPQKPHPFGNEYHTISDRDYNAVILYRVELVEGKDRPSELGKRKWADLGEAIVTMLCLSKLLHNTGKS